MNLYLFFFLFLLVIRCSGKRDYHSYTFLFEDILNTWLRQCLLVKGVVKAWRTLIEQKRFEQKRFCLNVFECVFPLFNIEVPHTYTSKNKNTVQHDPARYSRIEHARSRNSDHCLKTKHFLAHAPLTPRCLCQCNLQYIRPRSYRKQLATETQRQLNGN